MTDMVQQAAEAVRRRGVRSALDQQADAALQANKDFLALPAPSFPLSVAAQQALVNQVTALTRQNNVIIRLLVDQLLDAV